MAIFHMEFKVLGRGKGRSVVQAAAYRSGEKLYDERYGLKRKLGDSDRVVFTKIFHPNPDILGARPRETLWNSVEARESRKDAQLAREFEVALPVELTRKQQVDLLNGWCRTKLLPHGLAVDYAIHDKKVVGKPHNPHCHILVTLRAWEDGQWGPKLRQLNQHGLMRDFRKSWADHVNEALAEAGIEASIDHRSHEERGLTSKPTQKEGAGARGRVQRGLSSERVAENARIRRHNADLKKLPVEREILLKPTAQKVAIVDNAVNVETTRGLSIDVLNAVRNRGRDR